MPGNTPERDTVLERGDLIVALVSAAVALATDGRRIRSARLAHNAFKVELAQRVALRALQIAGGRV